MSKANGMGARTLTPEQIAEKFSDFFSKSNNGAKPYSWQLRFLESIIEGAGKWPDCIDVPTGAGKTVAIEIHLFLNALVGLGQVDLPNLPRRLFMTVNRRGIVDKQFSHAEDIENKLKSPEGILSEIVKGLRMRAGAQNVSETCLSVLEIRGGDAKFSKSAGDWRINPSQTAVICCTPDMFGSRLLFRGYGVTKQARPMEAGLFACDSVLYLDEAHLNRQLAYTAMRVSRIGGKADKQILDGDRLLQVCAASATLPIGEEPFVAGSSIVQIKEEDFEDDKELEGKMRGKKPIRLAGEKDSDLKCAVELHKKFGRTIACVFNSRSKALEFADKLRGIEGERHEVACVLGGMRAYDGRELREKLSSKDKLNECDFVVGTQAIEVGFNADFSGMLTSLANCDALIQRAGRVNRFGERDYGKFDSKPIVVCDNGDSSIYGSEELKGAREWVKELSKDDYGIRPWLEKGLRPESVIEQSKKSKKSEKVSVREAKRERLERYEPYDAYYHAKTSEELAAETRVLSGDPSNLDLWLKDDYKNNASDVYFAVRKRLRQEDGAMICDEDMEWVLERVPIAADELFPCGLRDALEVLESIRNEHSVFLSQANGGLKKYEDGMRIRPGDILIVDETAEIFRDGVVWRQADKKKADKKEPNLDAEKDIYREMFLEKAGTSDFVPYCFILSRADCDQAGARVNPGRISADEAPYVQDFINQILDDDEDLLRAVSECLKEPSSTDEPKVKVEYFLRYWSEDPSLGGCLVLRPIMPSLRYSSSNSLIPLREHNDEVAKQAFSLAQTLNIPNEICKALQEAGRYHDWGKAHPAFQAKLYYTLGEDYDPSKLIAKGGTKKHGLSFGSILPKGWRHEQASAAIAYAKLCRKESSSRDSNIDNYLVVRLVGASHGYGRALFPQCSEDLLRAWDFVGIDRDEPAISADTERQASDCCVLDGLTKKQLEEAARELFDTGIWEEIVEITEQRYGYWTCAYLEALLRASDAQVSRREDVCDDFKG